jgi:hypothetical protein
MLKCWKLKTVAGLLSQFQLFRPPARALAAETLTLERTLSDLVNQAVRIVHW